MPPCAGTWSPGTSRARTGAPSASIASLPGPPPAQPSGRGRLQRKILPISFRRATGGRARPAAHACACCFRWRRPPGAFPVGPGCWRPAGPLGAGWRPPLHVGTASRCGSCGRVLILRSTDRMNCAWPSRGWPPAALRQPDHEQPRRVILGQQIQQSAADRHPSFVNTTPRSVVSTSRRLTSRSDFGSSQSTAPCPLPRNPPPTSRPSSSFRS
jgi:hypothetical protein